MTDNKACLRVCVCVCRCAEAFMRGGFEAEREEAEERRLMQEEKQEAHKIQHEGGLVVMGRWCWVVCRHGAGRSSCVCSCVCVHLRLCVYVYVCHAAFRRLVEEARAEKRNRDGMAFEVCMRVVCVLHITH
jgi:hypothetical protein